MTFVQAGSIPSRLAAMQTNALQATLLQAPETLKAKAIGLRALLDLFCRCNGRTHFLKLFYDLLHTLFRNNFV